METTQSGPKVKITTKINLPMFTNKSSFIVKMRKLTQD